MAAFRFLAISVDERAPDYEADDLPIAIDVEEVSARGGCIMAPFDARSWWHTASISREVARAEEADEILVTRRVDDAGTIICSWPASAEH